MTLETLAKDIAASAEAQAKAMIKEAKAEAKTIVGDAEAKATSIRDEAQARAEREADQISQEMVASARQGNQKELLIARRGVLDATYEAAKAQLADPGMKGRATLLKSLLSVLTRNTVSTLEQGLEERSTSFHSWVSKLCLRSIVRGIEDTTTCNQQFFLVALTSARDHLL